MKLLILLPALLLSLQASADQAADKVACEAQKATLEGQLSAEHSAEVIAEFKKILIAAYNKLDITITEAHINVEAPVFTFHEERSGFEQLSTEVIAKVDAGSDSITARAYSYIHYRRDFERIDKTDELGRNLGTKLYCVLNTFSFDVEVTNAATKSTIEYSDLITIDNFSVELP